MMVFTIEYGADKIKQVMADVYETNLLTNSVTLWRLEDGRRQVATFRDVQAIYGEEAETFEKRKTGSCTGAICTGTTKGGFFDRHDPSGGDLPGEESELKEEKPKKQPQRENKKQVDYGKVWALRNAGWKAAAIAEEVKTSVSNVWRICAIMKEREKEETEDVDDVTD